MNNNDVGLAEAMLDAYYNTGQAVHKIASKFGVSVGKTYYLLRNSGCQFRKLADYHVVLSPEVRARISKKQKGKHVSAETRRKISEANECHYNGLNGNGHLKQHPKGYILAYVPKHPRATNDGYVMYHTVVVEREIGRYLFEDEEVHHINHVRDDNRPENLLLMKKHEHRSMHMRERHANKKGERTY